MEPREKPVLTTDTPLIPLPAHDLMAVVRHYQTPLLRYVGHMTGRLDHETEDVVQEVFLRLHRQVSRQGAGSIRHLRTWLFKVAHNVTMDNLRRAQRKSKQQAEVQEPAEPVQQALEEMDALGQAMRSEARQAALRELGQLPPEQRQVILLKIIQDMSLRQVAEIVGVSLSTVNYRLTQGLAELTRRLRQAGVV